MNFVADTANIAGAVYGVPAADGFALFLPQLDLRWVGASTADAFAQMSAACADPAVAMAIGDMELITILETIPEHPLSTEESRAESVTTLRGLPAVTRAELDRTLADPSPLLIDVWGPRCTACLLMAPVMTELHDRLGDEVRVMQVDGEADRELMAQLDTYALPTYLLFSGGERRGYFVGFRGVDAFERQIRAALLP